MREPVQACSSQLIYLPPYSPDLNSTEKARSKFKLYLRSAEAGTSEADRAINEALQTITDDNAVAWLHHCGYRSTAIMESL